MKGSLLTFALVCLSNLGFAQWNGNTFSGGLVNFKSPSSGGSFLMNFHSNVNYGSDRAFILVQDESSDSPGSGSEDLRMTIGVYNDFRHSISHSDELWFQGGGRLVWNVGTWDSQLSSLIGSSTSGTTGGFEWRINNSVKLKLDHSGYLTLGKNGTTSRLLFSAQTNDPAEIRHIESNNSAQFWINPSDDFDVGSTADYFIVGDPDINVKRFYVRGDGLTHVSSALTVGTTALPAGYELAIAGKAIMEEVKVEAAPWPDYVFSEGMSFQIWEQRRTS
ncbi:hypothetical protein [Marinoscillum luteum]|uniref:Uncharacterized protein n=1 Tax=Marinoscillum luteum TaxID=861051 RepID=A0ABW7NET2_9BACT